VTKVSGFSFGIKHVAKGFLAVCNEYLSSGGKYGV